MAPFPTLAVANYFIEKGRSVRGSAVDPMKLQKLLYFAHGWHLAVTGRPLIDEPVEAWRYGPVISSVYHEFKANGRFPIARPATCLDFDTYEEYAPRVPEDAKETREILEKVWKVYGGLTGPELSAMTHEPDTPWAKVWEEAEAEGIRRGRDIPNSDIRAFFVSLAHQDR